MEGWGLLAELVGLLALALLLGVVAGRLRQKAIVGYLLAGLIAGPRGAGLVSSLETVQFLAELGVALLLFSIGLEFSWQRIGALGKRVAVAGLLQIALSWVCGFTAAGLLGSPLSGRFVVGNVIALSSTAFVMRLLQDRSETDSRQGRMVIGILLLQDLALIPLLVLQSVVAEGLSGWAGVQALVVQLLKGGTLVGLFYVVVRVIVLRAFRGAGSYADRELPIILSVLVCLGCAWASHLAGLSPVLGAFLAGVLLADQPIADQVRANVMPLRAVFVTLFFASIGMLAGIPRLDELPVVLLLAAGIVIAKAVLGGAAIRLARNSPRVAILGGFAIAQIGEFSFVLAKDALNKGIIPIPWFEPLIAASVLTLIATPYLFPLSHWLVERFLRRRLVEKRAAAPEHAVDAVVVGYGPAGREITRALACAGVAVVVVEANPDLAARVESARVVVGDATNADILVHAGIAKAKVAIVSIPDPGVARTVLAIVREMAPDLPVLVRARYHRYADPIRRLGAETVADEEFLVGRELAELASRRLKVVPAD